MSKPSTFFVVLGAAVLAGHAALGQAGNIPDEVVAECNAEASASELPDCLKSGAIAFDMLALVQEGDFYGDDAARVIDICSDRNDRYHATWVCFQNAADRAVETRQLIGADAIDDACVAGISEPETYEQLEASYREKRQERFPDTHFFGGTMYRQFQGCPEEPAPTDSETGEVLQEQTGSSQISSSDCAAYSELEELVAGTDADALRGMFAQLESMNEPSPSDLSNVTGLSPASADFLHGEGDAQEPEEAGLRSVALLGAFLRDSHPELLDDFFEQAVDDQSSPVGELADEAAKGFLMMIIDAAYDAYHEQCR